MASPDEKRYPTNYANLVGVVVFIWISFFVVVGQALHDDTQGETATGNVPFNKFLYFFSRLQCVPTAFITIYYYCILFSAFLFKLFNGSKLNNN